MLSMFPLFVIYYNDFFADYLVSQVSFIEDKLCYNVGRELYIYTYRGAQKAADLSKPVDKKVKSPVN